MKRFSPLRLIAMASLLFLFLSCHKRGDFEVSCKVIMVAQNNSVHPGGEFFEGNFSYTPWGDPEKITWDVTTTGRPDYWFKYDKKHRLTGFIGSYNNFAGFDFYTVYKYGANNMITSDTTWLTGADINNRSQVDNGYIVHTYEYDSRGRVSKVVADYSVPIPNIVHTYTYDANGNKVRGDGAVYDNRKNWLRTNLVLAFIMRDYSMNNYKIADSYNNKGLPTSFLSGGGITFLNSIIDEIQYNCGHNH